MNEKNFEYLKDQLKYTGLGNTLENDLQAKLQKQAPEFQLSYETKFGNDTVRAALQFKKSDQSDMYFFNRYNLSFKPEHSPDKMEQTFYIGKENNITLKEAYNLMNGRAVNKDLTTKEGQVYNAWLQFDFKQTDANGNHKLKQFHQNYGFDLEKALTKHPIKELSIEPDRSYLLESLQKGNRQAVTFIQEGKEQRHFVEANPKFKSITVYDNNMQRLGSRQSKEEKQAPGESNTIKQEPKKEKQSQSLKSKNPETKEATNRRKTKQGHSLS